MTIATSPLLNRIPRTEREIRALAFLPEPGPELTGSPSLDDELRALFDDCNRWGRGSVAVSALTNALALFKWRQTPPRKWGADVTEAHKARAGEIVRGWLNLAKETS